ncbi:MAG: glutamine synthetase III [Desulfovibrio sp.]|nr:glutamine synthetase III [Desulfovibrio sp.]
MTLRKEAFLTAFSQPAQCTSSEEFTKPDAFFGANVFGLEAMRKRLPSAIYAEIEQTIEEGKRLNPALADVIANAMKDWALEHGATHYTHWFQPMTGQTAEKHDAFLSPYQKGHGINEFSGKMLITGEPDASSFPSGGIRSTFEARGYTAWDPSVPAFIIQEPMGSTLHIPTFFYSYSGEALDRKIPLQRSIQALSSQALRILKLFGNTKAQYVRPMVGPEQEYFLVDARLAALRPDLILAGRTLLGKASPKGQEMNDHYFGAIPPRVLSFMQDLEHELLLLGIPAKTRHNEVAPGQFELAPVFEDANSACDHNMLTMNMMRLVAARHGFVCLLHEKPFLGVNGSGKHNNWSLCDSTGQNLLNPGNTPQDNAQFLVFLAAVLQAVHEHSSLLRLGTIGAGNDHRLGSNEAPPAILSVYLGEEITDVIMHIIEPNSAQSSHKQAMEIGISTLPPLPKDSSDRNRTSPFAFTGNKFEFRAVGSSQSIAPVNTALNAAVADALDTIASALEAMVAKGASIQEALQTFLPQCFKEHLPIIFNGNGYTQEWVHEAKERGLPNDNTSVAALGRLTDPAVMQVLTKFGIFQEREIHARMDILYENYANTIAIEGRILLDMLQTQVMPCVRKALGEAASSCHAVRTLLPESDNSAEESYCSTLQQELSSLHASCETLKQVLAQTEQQQTVRAKADNAQTHILPAMAACRLHADALEGLLDDSLWPLPHYAEMLWVH